MDKDELWKAEDARIKAEDEKKRADARYEALRRDYWLHEDKMQRMREEERRKKAELRRLEEVNRALEEDNNRRIKERKEKGWGKTRTNKDERDIKKSLIKIKTQYHYGIKKFVHTFQK